MHLIIIIKITNEKTLPDKASKRFQPTQPHKHTLCGGQDSKLAVAAKTGLMPGPRAPASDPMRGAPSCSNEA